jgi:hypothetical protein
MFLKLALTAGLLSHGLLSGRTRNCRLMPGRWILWKDSYETLWLDDCVYGRKVSFSTSDRINFCGWSTGVTHSLVKAFMPATAVGIVKLGLSRFDWRVQVLGRRSVFDVRATRVLPSHLCVCGWDTSGSSVE